MKSTKNLWNTHCIQTFQTDFNVTSDHTSVLPDKNSYLNRYLSFEKVRQNVCKPFIHRHSRSNHINILWAANEQHFHVVLFCGSFRFSLLTNQGSVNKHSKATKVLSGATICFQLSPKQMCRQISCTFYVISD